MTIKVRKDLYVGQRGVVYSIVAGMDHWFGKDIDVASFEMWTESGKKVETYRQMGPDYWVWEKNWIDEQDKDNEI
jgi:hypothetical protein